MGHDNYAASAGRIVNSGPASGFGHWIVLEHAGGYRTVYGHMAPRDLLVKVGATVTAGQLISRVGNGGTSTGCHLHFEVHNPNAAIDPVPFLRQACSCIDWAFGATHACQRRDQGGLTATLLVLLM
nr:M23 family metallopeptidase [Kineococcus siccus]